MVILLIDNDLMDIEITKESIKNGVFDVNLLSYTDAEKSLNSLKDKVIFPDIILLDLYMPGMDGITFLQEIKKIDSLKNIPVFILTGSDYSSETIIKCYNLGATGYFLKPLNFTEIFPKLLKVFSENKINS